MSPFAWSNGSSYQAQVFYVRNDGQLIWNGVVWAGAGLRPVINLRSDVTFSGGNGSLDNPYTVSND